ncbi:MAG: hypothetical protein ACK5NT_14260 [Pyrinomonadaceae bacterium]
MAKRDVTISIKVDDSDSEKAVERLKARFKEIENISDKSIREASRNITEKIGSSFAAGGEREYLETIRRLQPELKQLQKNIEAGAFDLADYQRRMQLLDPATRTAIAASRDLGSALKQTGTEAEHGTNGLGKLLIGLNLMDRGLDFVKQKLGEA